MSNKLVINCSTGAREEIPLTDEEYAARDQARAEAEAQKLAEEQAAADKAAALESARTKLSDLGLTEAEIEAMLGL